MKHVLLIEEFPDHDGIEVTAATSIKEAADWCYTGEASPTRCVAIELPAGWAPIDYLAEDAMQEVIKATFDKWVSDDSDKTDVNNIPDFLLKHKPDEVDEEVRECIKAAEEDADHIRQELSNQRTL